MRILPVIFSGGAGTRLWPMSRASHPKQLQPLLGQESLLQQTAMRLPTGGEVLPPVIICNVEQRFLVAEQLREIGITPSLIVLEPVGRSTAPALAIPAIWGKDMDDLILVAMPSDHSITDTKAFQASVRAAAEAALTGKLMTLGIAPTKPHTGFGYIEKGEPLGAEGRAFHVTSFREKPDEETAKNYLASGQYLWNAGVFIFRANHFMDELDRLQPKMSEACREAYARGRKDLDFFVLDADAFARSPSLSIDYAVLEKSSEVGVVPASFDWSDVGGWEALWDIGAKTPDGNVCLGDVVTIDVKDSYLRSDGRLIAVLGLKDIVVVETPDALLVAQKSRVEEVKDIVAKLNKANRTESQTHQRVWRPWGFYEQLDEGERFQVKRIMVKPGAKLSLQMHHHRAEHWIVVSGTARVTCGDSVKLLAPNESTYIPLGEKHQLENPGMKPLHLIEVQSGDYLGEDDIVRLKDDYGRA